MAGRLFVFHAVFAMPFEYYAAASRTVEPFEVIWNGPSSGCKPLPTLKPYGIKSNANQAFNGSVITLMYKSGVWPTLTATMNATACWSRHVPNCSYNPWDKIAPATNGGVPQAANMTVHGAKLEADLNEIMPNVSSSSILIVDWEAWRPLYAENDDGLSFYREYSRRLVLADPNWNHKDNATATDAEASRRFDEGAKAFFTYTVNLIKQLRPNVRLGFYSQGIDQPIPQGAADNAALLWLWEIVDILAPSIYPSSNFTRDKGSIESMVIGALESAAMVKPPANRPEVYPYARAFVGEGGKPFTAEELAEQLQLSAGLGVDGIIVWGSSSDYDGGGCSMVDAELRTYAGNVVKQCIANRAACSATHCDGHGNCVDYNPNYLEETCIDATHAAPVTCRCKNGYAGPNCTQSLPALVPVIAELY